MNQPTKTPAQPFAGCAAAQMPCQVARGCALVNHIIPFSAVDGPGNRTAVFLQGCNLDCVYCHNPETRALCTQCGACIATCPSAALQWGNQAGRATVQFAADACIGCDACLHTCPIGASPKARWQTPQQVFALVQQQLPFIRGITVSGGECTLYPAFLQELFTLCKAAGLSTLIDSNGMVPLAQYPDLMAVTDGVMLDIKAFSPQDAYAITGAGNEMVLENLRYLAQCQKIAELRTVVVPELCDAAALVRALADYLSPHIPLAAVQYKLIALRLHGVRKAYRHLAPPCDAQMQQLAALARACDFGNVIVI